MLLLCMLPLCCLNPALQLGQEGQVPDSFLIPHQQSFQTGGKKHFTFLTFILLESSIFSLGNET